jgi:TP901 family phage tail tape measure protein
MEIAELVVAVRGQGIEEIRRALQELAASGAVVREGFSTTDETLKAYEHTLREASKTISTFAAAQRHLQTQTKAVEQVAVEERRRQWARAELLYKLDEAAARQTAEARKEAERQATLAIQKERERQWQSAEMAYKRTENAARAAAVVEQEQAKAAQQLARQPASLLLGGLLGRVDAASMKEMAEQTAIFRSQLFDVLVVWGSFKAAFATARGLVAPLTEATKAAIEFERQFAIVRRTVGGSVSEMARVRDALFDLMATRPFDPQEITNSAKALGELGVAAQEIGQATDYISRFAVASGIATDAATTMLGQILGATGVVRPTAKQIGELGSAVLKLGTDFAIGNEGVLTQVTRLSTLVTAYHLTESAALGLSTALGSLGVRADRGTSSFMQLFAAVKEADPGRLALFASVIDRTAEETARLADSDIGKFAEEFIHGLQRISNAGGDVDRLLVELGADNLRTRQTFAELAGGADLVSEALRTAEKAVGTTTDLMQQSDEMLKTTDASLKTFANSVWALGAALTGGLLGPLNEAVIALTDFTNAVRKSPFFFSGGFAAGEQSGAFATGFEQLNKLLAAQDRMRPLSGISPLVDAPEQVAAAREEIEEFFNVLEEPPTLDFSLDPALLALRSGREAMAKLQEEEKLRQKALRQTQVDLERAASSEEQYTEKVARYAAQRARGEITEAEHTRLLIAAEDALAESRERAGRATARSAKAVAELSEEQREINQLILDARTPREVYADTEAHLNELIAHHLPDRVRQIELQKAYNKMLQEEAQLSGEDRRKREAENLRKYAVALNPVVELEEKIAKIRAAAAAFPMILPPDVVAEAIANLKREVDLPEQWERDMRVMTGITQRSMNAISDSLTDAIYDGAKNGKEIMRDFAKDITNILLEEFITKPLTDQLIGVFRDFQLDKYLANAQTQRTMPSGMGMVNTTETTAAAAEMTVAVQTFSTETTSAAQTLETGFLKLLGGLSQGIGLFLTSLLGGGGEGFTAGGFFKALGIGALTGAFDTFVGSLSDATAVVNEFDQKFSGPGVDRLGPEVLGSAEAFGRRMEYSTPRMSLPPAGQAITAAPVYNITVQNQATSFDPRTASQMLVQQTPTIVQIIRREIARGRGLATDVGQRGT